MPSEVILPRVDMDMATGKISKWLVAPGATVAKGQPLFEIETDKATMEIEAETSGTIRDLAAAGATDIPVGSVVAWIFGESEATSAPAQAKPVAAAPDSEPQPAPVSVPAQTPSPSQAPAHPAEVNGRFRATPLARRLARLDGIDLGAVSGSGPRGRIQAADIVAPRTLVQPQPEPAVEARPASRRIEPAPTVQASDATAPVSVALKRLRGGAGRPLLLVHGFGADANGWRPFLQGQSLDRPVYGLDLPGHGTSRLEGIGTFDDLVDAVGPALAELEGADVMAHSLGGAVMTAVAARGLVDLRSLLLLAPAGLGPDINGGFISGFLNATSEASLAPWMAELVADPQAMPASFVRATLKLRVGTDRVEAQRRLAATLFPDGTQAFSTRADLARLRIPVRVVFGTADKVIPSRHATGLPPLVALHLLPGIGHMPHVEAPDIVATILAQTAKG